MTKIMLIDATSGQETRVAVVDGPRLEEFDYESAARKALKGNIYLAQVTRVEPSLQACFVEYGGNRHGFLPFSDIHPDYFRIPVADREAFETAQREALERAAAAEAAAETQDIEEHDDLGEDTSIQEDDSESLSQDDEEDENEESDETAEEEGDQEGEGTDELSAEEDVSDAPQKDTRRRVWGRRLGRDRFRNKGRFAERSRPVEVLGGDHAYEEDLVFRYDLRRQYKIQEVINRGQIMLVQVSKEERGNKGAAVTTYLSLPGRYCVLMPNSPRGGGVSRKIATHKDRARMRDLLRELEVPQGMSVILRTAGLSRTKTEIKRDLDYLMRLWDDLRAATLSSTAPTLIYEEANLIKRAVRDLYTRDIENIVIAGVEGYKSARKIMKMMIPSHMKRVSLHESHIPLFVEHDIEGRIAQIADPRVELKSGGSLVINPTEALVAIDVNSGRSTKGRHIEETALKTNLEAADEIARQLRLRDLGGLIVIDFIDMEDRRNHIKVEQRLKTALSGDRARIQIGRISSFGLLELSRQRLNPSLAEVQSDVCTACGGTGRVRSADASALSLLRDAETIAVKTGPGARVLVRASAPVALNLLNDKRASLTAIETRCEVIILVEIDPELGPDEIALSAQAGIGKRTNGEQGRKQIKSLAHSSHVMSYDDNEKGGKQEDTQENDDGIGETEDTKQNLDTTSPRRRSRRGGSRRRQDERNNEENAEEKKKNIQEELEQQNSQPTEDFIPQKPPKVQPALSSSVVYEVVSESLATKKKSGWWNRLIDKTSDA